MKKPKLPKRRDIHAASLADARFKPRVVQVKVRKILDNISKTQILEELNG